MDFRIYFYQKVRKNKDDSIVKRDQLEEDFNKPFDEAKGEGKVLQNHWMVWSEVAKLAREKIYKILIEWMNEI